MIGQLIGFDMRMRAQLYVTSRWSNELRSSYLMVPSVEWPLSVDASVWPSLFDDPEVERRRGNPLSRFLIPPDRSDFRQQAIGLWSSESAMERAVRVASASEWGIPIAIELFTERGYERDPDWRVRIEGIGDCVSERAEWYRAGFDVGDIGFVSGLSNCGWLAEEELALKRRWAPYINTHGLISELGVAQDFRADMDERAPEHAPFFVFGIGL